MSDQTKYTNKLANTRVLILGGSSGIGYAVAEAVLEHGASSVILSSSSQSRVDAAVSRLQKAYPSKSTAVSGFTCNLGKDETLESEIVKLLNSATNNKSKKLDHVVHTAGDPLAIRKITEWTLEEMKQAGNVRFFAPLLVAKHIREYVNEGSKSSFTITTGAVSQRPREDWSVVNGFATGLHGVTRGLALDLAPLRVNLISPGYIETELWNFMPTEQQEVMKKHLKANLPTQHLPQPSDVAEQFLAAMKDQNCTGTMFSSNGGSLLK